MYDLLVGPPYYYIHPHYNIITTPPSKTPQTCHSHYYYVKAEDRNQYSYIKRFFFDLCDDLGLELGNKFDKNVLDINTQWGTHYEPTAKDIEFKIKRLKSELKELEEWKKNI